MWYVKQSRVYTVLIFRNCVNWFYSFTHVSYDFISCLLVALVLTSFACSSWVLRHPFCPLAMSVNRDESLWWGGTPDVLARRTIARASLAPSHSSLPWWFIVCIRLHWPTVIFVIGHHHLAFSSPRWIGGILVYISRYFFAWWSRRSSGRWVASVRDYL